MTTIRNGLVSQIFICFSLGGLFSCQQPIDQPPNIILITVDDLGWTDLGCYGSDFYRTPNIDLLSVQGIKFTNAYAAAAVCSPTRSALMTGKYPARTGITDWIRAEFQGGGKENTLGYERLAGKSLYTPINPFHMELNETTIAEILKDKGYVTCHIGKWHLGTTDWYPEKQGFDFNKAGCDYGQPPSYFDPYISLPSRWQEDTLHGFPTMSSRKEGEYLTDREAIEAIEFIEQHRDEPFFLNLCHYAVHTPLMAKDSLIEIYESAHKGIHNSAVYAAMISSVDEALGMIRHSLEQMGISQRTIIIFTSDNGGLEMPNATDNDPLRSGKGYPYEGGIRIPLIMYWDGQFKAGSQSDEPVISMDLFPTVADLSGVNDSLYRHIDGLSLVPILTGSGALSRESLFWHFPHYRGEDIVPYSIIRKNQWKLIKRFEGKEYELFNLEEDMSELTDLSESEPAKVIELNLELTNWLNESGAMIPYSTPEDESI